MNPRLAAISGKLKGTIFTIDVDAFVIGRETAANVCIADASVSRRHTKIDRQDNGFVITDLESLNGTFVNDVPVKSRVLEHGDRVRIGDSQFLFLAHEGDVLSKSSDVTLDEAADRLAAVTGRQLRRQPAAPVDRRGSGARGRVRGRGHRDHRRGTDVPAGPERAHRRCGVDQRLSVGEWQGYSMAKRSSRLERTERSPSPKDWAYWACSPMALSQTPR